MRRFMILFTFAVSFFPMELFAQEESEFKDIYVEAGASAGLWLSGPSDVWFNGDWHTKSTSPLIKADVVVYLVDYFYLGSSLNFAPSYSFDNIYTDASASFFEFDALLGIRFYLSDKTVLKTGVEVGSRHAWGDYTRSQVDGVGVNLNIELQRSFKDFILVFNPGFLSQVTGSEEYYGNYYFLDWAPIFYLNVGAAFSLMEK